MNIYKIISQIKIVLTSQKCNLINGGFIKSNQIKDYRTNSYLIIHMITKNKI